ncbi:MAG TPA: L,D-transpeptidase family protein [Candidatus Limnocylindrales bacterium]|nr:L,D-transpeptidase family protein [Candidatus Limnocylindrales bacterium]
MRVPQLALWSAAVLFVAVAITAAATLLPAARARVERPPAGLAARSANPSDSPSISTNADPGASPSGVEPSSSRSHTPSPASALASRLRTLPAETTQVIIVHAPGYSGTHATLEAFTKAGGVWRPQFPAMAVRIAGNGFSDNHTEGNSTTPTGVYELSDTMYGIDPNPGVRYAYHRIVVDDWWNENPNSPDYNTLQHTPVNPGGGSEALWTETVAYRHFAVIRYNIPVTGHARGSGIFLHVGTGRSTAGCVSVPRSDLIRVLTWLDPAKSPRIVLSPHSALSRY